jgi:hypothetical protein
VRTISITTISILAAGLLAVSAVGVAAQDEAAADPMAPAEFKLDYAGEPQEYLEATTTETEYGESVRGDGLVEIPIEAGDPRASGLLTVVGNEEVFGKGVATSGHLRIVNDDGAWEGTSNGFLRLKKKAGGSNPYSWGASIAILTGEDAYEGLTLVLAETLDEWHGYILPTELLPPAPDLPAE